MAKNVKIRIIKKPNLGYRGHAEPDVGLIGTINDYCRKEQALWGPRLKDPTWTYMMFKAKDLGYGGREPVKLLIPKDCFEEVK